MKCEVCGVNNATIHTKVIINDEVVERYLCAACFEKEQQKGPSLNLNSLFADILGAVGATTSAPAHTCPSCGMAWSEFKKTGVLGCPACYDAFRAQLLPVISRAHGKTRHVGVQPGALNRPEEAAAPAAPAPADDIEALRRDLELAVSLENYEEAAVLRDKIKALSQEGAGK